MATMGGLKIVLMRKWDIKEGELRQRLATLHSLSLPSHKVHILEYLCSCLTPASNMSRLIKDENVTIAGG